LKAEHPFERKHRFVREVIETVALVGLMFIIINLAVQNYDVDGHSMEPSLHDTERIMVDKLSYRFHAPARGDIIVFIAPPQPDKNYVKRVIGLPGDEITVDNTRVTVNGVTLQETYVSPANQGNPYASKHIHLVLPPDRYFVLGDNRYGSSDSRDWGTLPRDNIIGRAVLVYWPFGQDNDGFVPDVSSVFAQVHTRGQASSSPSRGLPVSDDLALCLMPGVFLFGKRRGRRHNACDRLAA